MDAPVYMHARRPPLPRELRPGTGVRRVYHLEETLMRAFRNRIVTLGMAVLLVAGCAGAGQKTGEFVDDAAITAKVKTSLAKDPDVSAMAVNVDTDKGVVTLSGRVKSDLERRKAASLAQEVEGVRSVRNQISLQTN
jgi:osmotically-inducible protein OsmY